MSIPPPNSSYLPPTGDPFSISQDDRTMAMLAYLLGIVTGFVGPLIIWLIKKDQSKFVAYHALQAPLFHIAIVAAAFVLGVTVILAILAPVMWVVGVVFSIIAGLAANRSEWYELPVVGKIARQQTGV
ncbi:MAG: DUF4870 domain-containing protein [Janthinobacterium lividum]